MATVNAMDPRSWQSLRKNPEFQSGIIRFGIWFVAFGYLFSPTLEAVYRTLFAGYFAVYLLVLLSILVRPYSPFRRYLMVFFDISGVSLLLYAQGTVISPLNLIFVWIYIGYGFRYGRQFLLLAAGGTLAGYLVVALVLDAWSRDFFTTGLTFLVLGLLPLYQYMLQKKLEEAKVAAEISDKVKTEFLSTVSHELRTPLTTIVGMVQLLEQTPLDTRQQQYLRSLQSASAVLRTHIQDVLDIVRLGARELVLHADSFVPDRLLVETACVAAEKARKAGLILHAWISPRIPGELVGDELRLRQILRHLLENAVKFTAQGEVHLFADWRPAVDEGGGQLVFRVEDSGPGIAVETLPQVFEVFWQGARTLGDKQPGLGLGMTIVKDLAGLMGGEVEVRSTPGVGTLFEVRIPFSGVYSGALPPAPLGLEDRTVVIESGDPFASAMLTDYCHHLGMHVVNAQGHGADVASCSPDFILLAADSPYDLAGRRKHYRDSVGDRVPIIALLARGGDTAPAPALTEPFLASDLFQLLVDIGIGPEQLPLPSVDRTSQAATVESHPAPREGGRVLVVEDDPDIAMLVEVLLQLKGLGVETVSDGYRALDLLESRVYDLALVDLRMPGLDGQALVRQWRLREQQLERRRVPMVALTAETLESVRQETLAAGMDGFLNKPVDSDQLSTVLERFVGPGCA